MIRVIQHKELDLHRYRRCVQDSAQYVYSAMPEFLHGCHGSAWDCLIADDYTAVMPLPYRYFFGLKFIIRPVLCQQLGVFSPKDDAAVNQQFYDQLLASSPVLYYAFNQHNLVPGTLRERCNMVLPAADFELIYKNFAPQRRNKIRKAEKNLTGRVVDDISWSQAEDFIRKYGLGLKDAAEMNRFLRVLRYFHDNTSLWFSAYFIEDRMANLIAVYEDERSAALLGSFTVPELNKFAGVSLLIGKALQKVMPGKTFDFEGSDIPSIAEFFRGFGVVEQSYHVLEQSVPQAVKTYLKHKQQP